MCFPFFQDKFKIVCISCFLVVVVQLISCGNPGKVPVETPTNGTINISVDESFKPVIDSEIKVFESSFPDAKINVRYKSEAECFKDLASDSTRMIIVTRGLNKSEMGFYKDSIHFEPNYGLLAYDAIAIIVNNKSKDTILTMKDVQSLLNGTTSNKQVVMDGVSQTSTVRFAIDSVLKGGKLGKNVVAARSSEGVINYVADHENAVGFIGVSWIGNQEDPQQQAFLQKVKIAAVQCTSCLGETYVQPYQANIYLKRYPMIRGLYYILKENFSGIGNNFVNFLQYERGQLIFKRAYLLPGRMSFDIRDTQIAN
ncbi:MAG: substrate-binding domain-containing protein [Bacteroidetes bacterium]|nr:substrate-binding domain-containing protein [Bacteroidota bacterium]MBS1975016.1 substrate-binding domain-containing protein [Bacteroidota bacterium]